MVAQTEVNVVAFSPDGKIIATVDDDGKLKLWEVATGRCRWEKRAHWGNAVVARFSPDGFEHDEAADSSDRKTGTHMATVTTGF